MAWRGGLGGDAAEVLRRNFDLDLVTELHIGLERLGAGNEDLVVWVLHLLDDDEFREGADGARLGIQVDTQVAGAGGEVLPGCCQEGAGNGLDKHLPLMRLSPFRGNPALR